MDGLRWGFIIYWQNQSVYVDSFVLIPLVGSLHETLSDYFHIISPLIWHSNHLGMIFIE